MINVDRFHQQSSCPGLFRVTSQVARLYCICIDVFSDCLYFLFIGVVSLSILLMKFDTTWLHFVRIYLGLAADRVSWTSGKFARDQLFVRGLACLCSIIPSPWQQRRSRTGQMKVKDRGREAVGFDGGSRMGLVNVIGLH